jgi:hypothetical protein
MNFMFIGPRDQFCLFSSLNFPDVLSILLPDANFTFFLLTDVVYDSGDCGFVIMIPFSSVYWTVF